MLASTKAAKAVVSVERSSENRSGSQRGPLSQKALSLQIQTQSEAVAATSQQLDAQKAELEAQQSRLTMQAAMLAAKEK